MFRFSSCGLTALRFSFFVRIEIPPRSFKVAVPHQLLHGDDVAPAFEEARRIGMSKFMELALLAFPPFHQIGARPVIPGVPIASPLQRNEPPLPATLADFLMMRTRFAEATRRSLVSISRNLPRPRS